MLADLLEPLPRDAPAPGDVLEERHDVLRRPPGRRTRRAGGRRTARRREPWAHRRGALPQLAGGRIRGPTLGCAMLSTYRRILSVPGAALFSSTGLVARLPISMVSLGIVLLVSSATGSYGLAGSVAAAYLLANGGFAILQGRLIDRLGQSRVLPLAIAGLRGRARAAHVVGRSPTGRSASPTSLAVRQPARPCRPSGSCVRARWSHALTSADRAPDGVRARGRGRRDRLHARADPGHGAGHRHPPGRRADLRPGVRRVGTLVLRRPARHRAAGAPARLDGRTAPRHALAHRGPARPRLRRPRDAVRGGGGLHRRLRRGAGQPGVRRVPARALGGRQPDRRRCSPVPSSGAAARTCGCAGGRSG